MFFFSLAVFVVSSWLAPWWVAGAIGFAIGTFREMNKRAALHFSSASGVAWAALAYVQDGRNFGLISRRLGGLFNLPHFSFVFLLMALLGFVTAFLCLQAGQALRGLITAPTNSQT